MKTTRLIPLAVILLIGCIQMVVAQNPSWKWAKWSDGTQTTVRSASADASGNLYATGSFYTQTKFDTATLKAFQYGAFAVKYSALGVVTWAKVIENTSVSMDSKSMAIDPNGNLYITGAYTGTLKVETKTLTGGGHYLAKFDNNGNIQWVVNTQGSNAVAADNTGIFVAGGSVIEKFDGTGTITWTITGVKSNQGYTNFYSVALSTAGNLVLGGDIDDKWTFGTKVITGGYQNIILMEVSSAGLVNWAKTLGSNTHGGDHAQHIALDDSNNIIMTGKVGGASVFDGVSLGSKNGYLVKLNPSGVTQWGTILTNSATIYGDGGIFVAADADNNFYVTGGCGGGTAVNNGSSTEYVKALSDSGNNAYILKFNPAGVFQAALTNKEMSLNNSRGMALAASTAGLYYAGVCAPNSEWGTLKVTGYGSVFAKIADGQIPGGISKNNVEANVLVYPNPTTGVLNIELPDASFTSNETSLTVVNMMGETVLSQSIHAVSTTMNLENHPAGVYFLYVWTASGVITRKVMKQ